MTPTIKTILTWLMFMSLYYVNAQCLAPVSGFGNGSTYRVTGTVSVTLNTDATITLDLGTDFRTSDGPDVVVYLIASRGLSNAEIAGRRVSSFERIYMGLVSNSSTVFASGAKSFRQAIPSGVDIGAYDKVLFYCRQFDVFWDFGSFRSFGNNNCAVLSTEAVLDRESFHLVSNLVSDTVAILSSKNERGTIEIYDASGRSVHRYSGVFNTTLDIASLASGLYVLKAMSNRGKQVSKKIIHI